MLEVFDKERKKLAVLQNATNISEKITLNAIGVFSFSMPSDDDKNIYCKAFNMVSLNGGELYRIIKKGESESYKSMINYQCEHVLSSLLNTSLYGYHVVGNIGVYTADVINYLLSKQKDWVLYECDFNRQFEYGWEQENLLSALLGIANRFTEKYKWVTDTTVYPWRLSLKRIDENALPIAYVHKGYNQMQLTKDIDYSKIVTRLYALGAGEGVNQLKIDGRYLQSPNEITDKYGITEFIWIDRRYTNKESLTQAAQKMLKELQEPYTEYSVDFIGDCNVGDIVQLADGIKSFVVEKNMTYGDVSQISYKIANKPYDVANGIADMADRQRIEMTYSQGATQIYADSIAENADSKTACELRFYIPQTMAIINAVKCRIRLSQFRAYSKTTASEGNVNTGTSSSSTTTVSGGEYKSSGASSSTTTRSGGGETSEPSDGYFLNDATQEADGSSGRHRHRFSYEVLEHTHKMPQHTHEMEHTHRVDTSHSHNISHTHTVNTAHSHDVTPGISFFGNAQSFTLLVGGITKGVYGMAEVQ